VTGLARDRAVSGIAPLVLAPPIPSTGRRRRADVARELAVPTLIDQAASIPAPSMRGLEAMIAIGSLGAALLLGLLR
jgi:hypothetical protein